MASEQGQSQPHEQQRLWRRLLEGWKRFARALGVFNTRVIMTVLYFIIVLPLGLVVRLISDPLRLRPGEDSNWVPVESQSSTLESARNQY